MLLYCVVIIVLELVYHIFRFAKNSGGVASPANKQTLAQQENQNHRAFIRRSSFSDDATDASG